jgi:hypothetical protein
MAKKKKKEIVPVDVIVNNCEWCFQFDNDEPIVFGSSNEGAREEQKKITFTLGNNTGSNITFKSNEKILKLFVRERA